MSKSGSNNECLALDIWGIVLTLKFNNKQQRTDRDEFHHQVLSWILGHFLGNEVAIKSFSNKQISMSSLTEKFSEYSGKLISQYLGKCDSWVSKNKSRNRIFSSANILILVVHVRLSIHSESTLQFLKRLKLNSDFSDVEHNRARNAYMRKQLHNQEVELQEYSTEEQTEIKLAWMDHSNTDLSNDRKIYLINELSEWAFLGWLSIDDFYLYFLNNHYLKCIFDELFPDMKLKPLSQVKRHFRGYPGDVNNNNRVNPKHCIFKACNLLKSKSNRKNMGQVSHKLLNEFLSKNFTNELIYGRNKTERNQWISFKNRIAKLCKLMYGDETPTTDFQCSALLLLAISSFGRTKCFLVRLFNNIAPGSTLDGHTTIIIHKYFDSKRSPFHINSNTVYINIKLLSKLTNQPHKRLEGGITHISLHKLFQKKNSSLGKKSNLGSESQFKCFYMYRAFYYGEDVTVVGYTAVALEDVKGFNDITDEMFQRALKRPHAYDSVLDGEVELFLVSTANNIDNLENYVKKKCSQKYEFLTDFDPKIKVDGLNEEAWIVDYKEVEQEVINKFCGRIDPVMPDHIPNTTSKISGNRFYYYPLTYEDQFLGYTFAMTNAEDEDLDVFFQNFSFQFDSFEQYKHWLFLPNPLLKNLSPYSLITSSEKDLQSLVYNDFDELLRAGPIEF